MDQKEANIIYDGWEKYKENHPENISAEFDQELEKKSMEANGIEPLPTDLTTDEKANLIANMVQRKIIEQRGKELDEERQKRYEREEQQHRRNIKLFKGAVKIIAGVAITGAVLMHTPMAGKIANVIIEYDNQKFNEHVDTIKEEVYQNTGRTVSEELKILQNPNLTSEEVLEEEKAQSYR
jgi:hypothetical protein